MSDLFRESVFGHFIRLISNNRLLQYAEEKDPKIWKQYIDHGQTKNMALHGNAAGPTQDEKEHELKDFEFSLPPLSDPSSKIKLPNYPSQHSLGPQPSLEFGPSPASSKVQLGDYESRYGSQSRLNLARTEVEDLEHQHQLSSTITGQRIDTEKGRDITMVSWYGDNDPENPQNWSTAKKTFVAGEICLLTTSVYIGSAIYSAGTETIVEDFGVSATKATLGLTLFVIGYSLGPMLWAPMSEIPQIGRNPVYIGTLLVFVIIQVPTALAVNFAMLLSFRFLSGFIGSPVLAIGGATMGDMFSPKKRAYPIGIWGIAATCGPVLGPLVGGFAAQHEGWKWTIWELMWLCSFSLALFIFTLPETNPQKILYRRTSRLRKLTGIQSLRCQGEIMAENMAGKDIVMMILVRPITMTFGEPMVLLLNLYIALIYGLLYIWFESFPIVFEGIYGFNLSENGLAFLGILIGNILVIPPFFWYLYFWLEPKFGPDGQLRPEDRLPPAFVGAFCIPVCLFWFGWSARPSIHWIMPIVGSGWFSIGLYLLFNSVLNYLPDAYPDHAASVLAGNDFMRSAFGAAFPLFATGMYHNLGIDWASTLLGLLSVAFIPIPFVLYKFGPRIRKRSKLARQDLL